ncbi:MULTISPECIES: methyltransferase domain-containing protein [Streptomyces]|uniref:Class I SAM-dependent methyltransferase n=3 Tax=Streptomyces TaxID=1883 RepID=A0ACC7Y4W1_9ACTN|nr:MULTISPECIES: methyltransferase domain-containing protein [Streptomyces]MBF4136932.1 methyltransferase domain-containing protein [Streptomyces albidoflavus]NUV76953.1 class I SAM-dependent methyltransferase [Streptomyces fungicidicus]
MPLPQPPASAPRDPAPDDDWGDLVGLLGPAGEAPWGPEGAAPPAPPRGTRGPALAAGTRVTAPPSPDTSAGSGGLGDPVALLIPAHQVVPADEAAPGQPASTEGLAWEAEQRRPAHPECARRGWTAVREARRVRQLVRSVTAYGEPESWLDVDAGDGRFAAVARPLLPYTAFDGTGLGEEVERARADGVLDEAYRGTLPLLAGELAGRYDVVGLLHQLGDCPDPVAELAAARRVLRPGGLLLVEAPDPGCRTAGLLGPWCLPHCAARPQPTAESVRELLAGLEFDVLAVDRVAGHVPRTLDALRAAVGLPGARAARGTDRLLAPLLRRTGLANAWRIVARRPPLSP